MAQKRPVSPQRKRARKNNAAAVIAIVVVLAVVISAGVLVFGHFGSSADKNPVSEISPLPVEPVVTPSTDTPASPVEPEPSLPVADPVSGTGSEFTVHFIDIGQGDAILLEKDGKFALVDAGETTTPSTREAQQKLFSYLDSHGVTKLEFFLMTHQDYDHIGSAMNLLKTYSVGVVYDNGFVHTSKTYENLLTYILENDVTYTQVRYGDTVVSPWADVAIKVLSPSHDLIDKDVNHNSIVLKITYGDISYLLTGDAEKKTENYILSTGEDISADILKGGHHGSSESGSTAFLRAVDPDVVVISCGTSSTGNSYGHPHTEFLERLVQFVPASSIYRTDVDGSVAVTTNGKTYTITTENQEHDLSQILLSGNGELVAA